MLEDFAPKDDKPNMPKGGDVIQPSATQQQQSSPSNITLEGPYKPTILDSTNPQNTNNLPNQQNTSQPTNTTTTNVNENTQQPQLMVKKRNKNTKKILFIAVIVLLLAGGFAGWWFFIKKESTTNTSNNNAVSSATDNDNGANLVIAPLSGLGVEENIANRPVTSITIENSGEARPQSGLMEADVVFEAIAEGGITRFLALYQSNAPEYIGPIRSARPYYVEWAKAFDAGYVHAGGSPDGLQTISSLGVKDISAFSYGDDIFFRTSDRQSPHNLYSSFTGLDKVNKDKGFVSSKFTPWKRKQDVLQTPTAGKIDITISSSFYNPSYTYDPATNSYFRSQGGGIHKDEKSGKQLAPKTVLVMAMNRSQNGIYSIYITTGSGKFIAFQDGQVTEGTWERAALTDQYSFKDANGFDYLFNKGQTWVSVVTDTNEVKHTP